MKKKPRKHAYTCLGVAKLSVELMKKEKKRNIPGARDAIRLEPLLLFLFFSVVGVVMT